jgi:hypothetical protein
VQRFGGFLAKYMGDGVLVYFGYPQAHEDDAEQAVRAALALVEAVAKLDAGEATSLHVRVGIATGLVIVGDFISEGPRHENEVVGETPNLAARLQTLAEPDAVVISSETRRLLGNLFECRELAPVQPKGFHTTVRAYQVLGEKTCESRFKALHGTQLTTVVGRSKELELLLDRWDLAKGGEGQIVWLSGEPGIGKSRLVQALQQQLEADARHRLMAYQCSPERSASALHPVIAQLERAAGFLPWDDSLLASGDAGCRAIPGAGPHTGAAERENARGPGASSRGLRGTTAGSADIRGSPLGRSHVDRTFWNACRTGPPSGHAGSPHLPPRFRSAVDTPRPRHPTQP